MDNRKKTKIYEYLFIAAVSVVTVLLFVFTALMPYGNEIILILANGLTLSSALVIILYRDRKKLLWRIFLIVYIVSAVFLAVYIPVEKYGFIEHLKNPDELRRIILSTGNFGIVVFFLINLASVIILPVPASLLVVVGALVYGPWKTFFISASATFAGSLVCFYLGRKLGKKLLYWLFDRKKVDKYAALLGKKGKAPFVMMMFLPFFPDDLICITAGMTDMGFRFFAISVAIARTAYIFIVSFLGSGEIIPFRGWGIAVWIAIFALCVFLSWFINKKISAREKSAVVSGEKSGADTGEKSDSSDAPESGQSAAVEVNDAKTVGAHTAGKLTASEHADDVNSADKD